MQTTEITTSKATTSTKSTGTTARRRLGKGLAAIAIAVCATVAFGSLSAPAGAQLYAGSGAWGWNGPSAVSCRYLDAWGQLRVEVPPPTAYAFNRYAGGGNDWQMVRYRLFFVDPRSGQTLSSTGYSGLAWARDNAPAAWSGTTMMSFPWRSHIQVHTRIEFFDRNGRYEGFTAHRADRYTLFNGYTVPGIGNLSWCAKVM